MSCFDVNPAIDYKYVIFNWRRQYNKYNKYNNIISIISLSQFSTLAEQAGIMTSLWCKKIKTFQLRENRGILTIPSGDHWVGFGSLQKMSRYTFFYMQLGYLAFSLRFWPKINQLLSTCPASDLIFSLKTANFH